jgi:hypothetical protein
MIDRDLKLAEGLVKTFDAEIARGSPQLENGGAENLDFLVKYLRKVHGFCFYTGVRCEDERQLAIKTVQAYTRTTATAGGVPRTTQS